MFVIAAVWLLSPWDLGDEVCPGDLVRFPADYALAAEYADVANDHFQWVRENARHVPWINGYEWQCRARHSQQAWYHLSEAWRFHHIRVEHGSTPNFMVNHLSHLYDVIGPENYRAGLLPDPIPYRRVMP
jgi:hypothetical protein